MLNHSYNELPASSAIIVSCDFDHMKYILFEVWKKATLWFRKA